ncbi:hypothetical protein [Aneurinibacillus uraniidurans]|uniref:hypothetical protein n=1 Tax=Aneurinibacillus uraniidurans TaxID=2966586 RepID=UPI00234912FA|nr:hypothetical protein [Aneurinibacillus sp. B1]WCN36263.1 hypothetical protein PO771_10195 [Aneurinibacillus sp. B1]
MFKKFVSVSMLALTISITPSFNTLPVEAKSTTQKKDTTMTSKQVIDYLKKIEKAQDKADPSNPTSFKKIMAPYYTSEAIQDILDMYEAGADFYYVAHWANDKKAKISYSKDKKNIYITQHFPYYANESVMTTSYITLTKDKNTWKVSDVRFDLN